MFLDADDELMPGALEHFEKLVRNNNGAELICCEFVIKKQDSVKQQFKYNDGIISNVHKAWLFGEICPRTDATIHAYKRAFQ